MCEKGTILPLYDKNKLKDLYMAQEGRLQYSTKKSLYILLSSSSLNIQYIYNIQYTYIDWFGIIQRCLFEGAPIFCRRFLISTYSSVLLFICVLFCCRCC